MVFVITDPVLLDAILRVQATLCFQIACAVYISGRQNFDDEIWCGDESIIRDHIVPTFVTHVDKVRNHSVVVTEDCSSSRYDEANRVLFEVIAKLNYEVVEHQLVRYTRCTGHEEFSFNELVAIAIVIWIILQIRYGDEVSN